MVVPSFWELGAAQQALTVARGLVNESFRIGVVAIYAPGPLQKSFEDLGVPTMCMDSGPRDFIRTAYRIRNHVKKLNINIVHSWSEETNATAALATKRSSAVTIGSCYNNRYRQSWADTITKPTGLARIVLPHSTIVDPDGSTGVDNTIFEIIPNAGVSIDNPVNTDRRQLLHNLGLSGRPDTKIIGTVCDLVPQARLKDLVWATDLIKCVRDDVHLVIWGQGNYQQNIQRFAEALGISEQVHIRHNTGNILELLPALDAYWHSHDMRPFDNGILAAMSSGVPVVAAKGPGMDALIPNKQTGALVQLGAKDEFARSTNVLVDDPKMKKQFADAARQLMKEHYSTSELVDRFRELYQEVA